MTPDGIVVGPPSIGAPSLIALAPAKMHKAFMRWREQRYNADHRGIPFELTLADWLSIWIGSGHYHQRGRRSGQYVMSRPGDTGPYSVDNVTIVLAQANLDEGRRHPCAPKTRAKIASRLKGNTNNLGHRHKASSLRKMNKAARARARRARRGSRTSAPSPARPRTAKR
jgi:hypothetical protein